jgi:hypothetical protein
MTSIDQMRRKRTHHPNKYRCFIQVDHHEICEEKQTSKSYRSNSLMNMNNLLFVFLYTFEVDEQHVLFVFCVDSLNGCYQTNTDNQMCHTEMMECRLRHDSLSRNSDTTATGFGFTIQNTLIGSDRLLQAPIVNYIEENSVAERYETNSCQ